MKQKKLMLLGGSRYLLPVIKKAHELSLYVITCDYLPDNIAHKYSDEYQNISITDCEKMLLAAKKSKIDGIMSFATDPGVVTAAYIAEKMGLAFQGSYESTAILQDKGLFRKFLKDNGFNTPKAKRYDRANAEENIAANFSLPIIVKPVDSAGSKGVSKIESFSELSNAINLALKYSHTGAFIVEDFLNFDGYHSSADPFTVDGELKFITYSDQLFDTKADNLYTPSKIIWPSTMKKSNQDYLTDEIARLMKLLNMRTGIYNIESCVSKDGKPYIMEVSPRGGGCKIAELQNFAYGVDLIENEIRKAVELPLMPIKEKDCDGHWCEMVVHANVEREGKLISIGIDDDVREKYLKLEDVSAKPGDIIKPFTGANMSLGDLFLRFESRDELDEVMEKSDEWLHINVEPII